jgi:hypothetical protein
LITFCTQSAVNRKARAVFNSGTGNGREQKQLTAQQGKGSTLQTKNNFITKVKNGSRLERITGYGPGFRGGRGGTVLGTNARHPTVLIGGHKQHSSRIDHGQRETLYISYVTKRSVNNCEYRVYGRFLFLFFSNARIFPALDSVTC